MLATVPPVVKRGTTTSATRPGPSSESRLRIPAASIIRADRKSEGPDLAKYRRIAVVFAALVALGVGVCATLGPPPPSPNPPGTFAFAALGDAPYDPLEDLRYRVVLEDLEAHDLAWVLHVGDIIWHPCTDRLYERVLRRMNGLRHPVIYTPGDNEWTDCWEPGSGRFAPLERLDRLREVFFRDPTRTLGGRPFALESQGGGPGPFTEFVENARWEHGGFLFATVHLVGSVNGLARFPGRTAADSIAARRRTEAATAWMRDAFAGARLRNASGVVLAFHANPAFEGPVDDRFRRAFEPFLSALEEEVERFPGPVLVIQGDDHEYIVDHPLVRRTTGRRLSNLTRLQVPGSPRVGWVRVVVRPGSARPFTFEERVVPGWKHW
jgi:hypothetical protein